MTPGENYIHPVSIRGLSAAYYDIYRVFADGIVNILRGNRVLKECKPSKYYNDGNATIQLTFQYM